MQTVNYDCNTLDAQSEWKPALDTKKTERPLSDQSLVLSLSISEDFEKCSPLILDIFYGFAAKAEVGSGPNIPGTEIIKALNFLGVDCVKFGHYTGSIGSSGENCIEVFPY